VSDNVEKRFEPDIYMHNFIFFFGNRAVYEIMWKNVYEIMWKNTVEPDRSQMAI